MEEYHYIEPVYNLMAILIHQTLLIPYINYNQTILIFIEKLSTPQVLDFFKQVCYTIGMEDKKLSFEKVVIWLCQLGLPLNDAIQICRRDLKCGLIILNKLKHEKNNLIDSNIISSVK